MNSSVKSRKKSRRDSSREYRDTIFFVVITDLFLEAQLFFFLEIKYETK
jgi:hypothetical protein